MKLKQEGGLVLVSSSQAATNRSFKCTRTFRAASASCIIEIQRLIRPTVIVGNAPFS